MNLQFPTAIENFFYSHCNDIKQLSKSFLQAHNLTYFFYMRVYKNNHCILVTTHPELSSYILRQQTAILPAYPKELLAPKFYHLIPYEAGLEIMRIISTRFNFYNPFSIIYPTENFYDIFCFGVDHSNPEAINYYFNHSLKFESFANACKKTLDKYFIKNDFLIELPAYMYNDNNHLFSLGQKQSKIYQQIKLDINGFPVDFTQREFECLQCLAQGNSAKQTAEKLAISTRTVESYLSSIRQKTFCRSKIELLSKISRAIG